MGERKKGAQGENSGDRSEVEEVGTMRFFTGPVTDQMIRSDGNELIDGHSREYRGKHRSHTRGWSMLKKFPKDPRDMV